MTEQDNQRIIDEEIEFGPDILINDDTWNIINSLYNSIPEDYEIKAPDLITVIRKAFGEYGSMYFDLNDYNTLVISDHTGPSSKYDSDKLYIRLVFSTSKKNKKDKLEDKLDKLQQSDAYTIEYVFKPIDNKYTINQLSQIKQLLKFI